MGSSFRSIFSIGDDSDLDTVAINIYGFKNNEIPSYSDEIFKERIANLSEKGSIDLKYNDKVREYIDNYTSKNRTTTQDILGRAEVYFPLIEDILKEHNLPDELKYLAVIESALRTNAVSPGGAAGLWQFIPGSARANGLKVGKGIDERKDVYKSTKAVSIYLTKLYAIFGDWNLVIAAYNCGEGTVQRAMAKSGKKDYWSLLPYLPSQTRTFVPAFIAAFYTMNYSAEHNLFPKIGS